MAFQNTGFQGDGFQVGNVTPPNTLGVSTESSGPVFWLDQTYVRAAILGSAFCLIASAAPTLGQAGYAGGPNFKQPPRQDWCVKSPLTLVGVVQAPFAQTDWPNPRGYLRNPQDWQFRLSPRFLQRPFSQTDWPNPRGAPRGNQDWTLRTYQGILSSIVPFAEYDWPVPKGAKSVPGFEVSGLALQSAVVTYPASITFDWPNPKGYEFPVSLRTWTDSFKIPLTTVVGFNQRDWPNPRGPKGVDGFTQAALTLALQPSFPFHQTDWPVPLWKVSYDLRGFTDKFKLPLTTVRPPSIQRDWPVPKGYGPRQGFEQKALTFATFVAPTPPPRQTDWPNPRGWPPLKVSIQFPASQNFWPPTPPIPPPEPTILPRAKFIKVSVSGPQGRSQVSGPKAKTQVRGPKGRTDASDP